MANKVAVVTGANKGIGLAIVRALCVQFHGDVILTARDKGRGQAAVATLEKEGLHPKFYQLDITDHASIERLRDFLQHNYLGLDVLVNNAAIAFKSELPEPDPELFTFPERAETTCQINYFATLDVCEVLFPLLRPHARVCNVSSGLVLRARDDISPALIGRLLKPDIAVEELNDIVRSYIRAAQGKEHMEGGFAEHTYAFSKICLNVMTEIQQREMDKKGADDIVINAGSPGFCATDMTNNKGTLTADEGAITPTYIVLLPPNVKEPRGKFVRDKKECDWRQ